jgi:hypothetical protein
MNIVEPARPSNHTTKPDAIGAATRWHGYVARDGFGITLIRNQTSAANPVRANSHLIYRISHSLALGFGHKVQRSLSLLRWF